MSCLVLGRPGTFKIDPALELGQLNGGGGMCGGDNTVLSEHKYIQA